MTSPKFFCHNRERLIEIGIIKICSECSFETLERREMREHGLSVHGYKHVQKNDMKYQLEVRKK